MQAQKQSPVSEPVAASPGVEPELFCAVPRHVAPKASVYSARFWLTNSIAAMTFIAYYLAVTPALGELRYLAGICVFGILTTSIAWLVAEARVRRDVALLRDGYATRATVIEFVESTLNYEGQASLKIQYETNRGKKITDTLYVTWAETEKYGFAVGVTFTVVIAPGEAYSPVPYFRVTEATIPGAPPPKIAPP